MATSLKPDDNIVLDFMGSDPDPIPVGTKGRVLFVGSMFQGSQDVDVKWANGRTLSLVIPPDRAHKES